MSQEIQKLPLKDSKKRDLILSLLFDVVGLISYVIPVVAESIDFIWAPLSGLILAYIYKGTMGKVAGVISFLEEISPGLDFIPTFTLTWIYKYIIKKGI